MALSDTFSKLFKKDELRPFPGPESFMFGVATADHQCEACNPECWDIRDWWEKDVTNVPRKHATDFWNRYKEDIELAANLGCNAFRFSIAWSQVQRKEEDKFDENAFKHYQSLIDTILAYDMKPVLTLHHFTWPIHVENRGGMIEKEFPEIFEKYVTAVAEHFAEYVPYWITFNEPNLLIGGYLNPWMNDKYAAPPGQLPGTPLHEQMEDVGNLISNLFLSHKRAYDVIKARNPRALVGVNQYCYGLPSWLQQFVNRNASAIKGDADLQRQVDRLSLHRDLIRGNRVSRMRGITFDKNKVDVVIAALTETSEREQEIRFSEAYFVTGHQLLVRSDSTIETRKDLDGKLIGFIKGSTSEKILFQLPLAQPKAFSDLKKALNALKKGSVDAIISDSAILLGLISRNAGQYTLLKEPLSKGECYAIGIPQGDNSLLEITDEVVRDFMKSQKAQQWKTSYEKQTGQKVEDLPPKKTRALVVNEATEIETRESTSQILKAPEGSVLRRIQDRDYLVVGVREGLQDLGVSDLEIDKFSWLEVELAQALAERILGDANKVQYRTLNVEKRISAMKNWPDLFNTILKHLTILSTLIMADWWYMGMKGNLDPYLCPPECKETLDFVGLDYYWGIPTVHPERIMRLIDAADRKFDLAPVWPNGLYDTLKNLHNQFPEKPIIIFENGSVKTADGLERADYLRRHIKQVQRAVQDDLNVKGYFCWSITSNREWDLTFDDASDFGLYRIELDKDPELKRTRTGCAGTYEEIIRSRRA
jgi:beta-glucosidase/6-phospho-beta-glucosidase/beta-galactosidase/ABC-type amino acid transport substrate-binding protein